MNRPAVTSDDIHMCRRAHPNAFTLEKVLCKVRVLPVAILRPQRTCRGRGKPYTRPLSYFFASCATMRHSHFVVSHDRRVMHSHSPHPRTHANPHNVIQQRRRGHTLLHHPPLPYTHSNYTTLPLFTSSTSEPAVCPSYARSSPTLCHPQSLPAPHIPSSSSESQPLVQVA